jgi:hypothetical protein
MVVIYRRLAQSDTGELQIGWPSWDPEGKDGELSIRFAYKRADGKFARTSPEVKLSMLQEMNAFVGETLTGLLGTMKPPQK